MNRIEKLNTLLSAYKEELEEERAEITEEDVPAGRLNQVIKIETISFLVNITKDFFTGTADLKEKEEIIDWCWAMMLEEMQAGERGEEKLA